MMFKYTHSAAVRAFFFPLATFLILTGSVQLQGNASVFKLFHEPTGNIGLNIFLEKSNEVLADDIKHVATSKRPSKLKNNLNKQITSVSTTSGNSILAISSTSNKFSQYITEILTAEGLNGFNGQDISAVTSDILKSYDVVIVGSIPLTDSQVSMLSTWVDAGGTLIAMKPEPRLAQLLGIAPTGSTLANKYLLVNTATGPGRGIVNQTIQYQGAADLYSLNGAISIANLYSSANTSTSYPAVTIRKVGNQGGTAVAFSYDLARSIIYTRQGNPEWAGQKRDGQFGPIRSDDQFYPDWIDLSKVMIPQADEQQRLLANIITLNARKPVPRFWYLPRGLKAAVVMTGDDHGNGGTKARFNQYLQLSTDNSAEAVADWRAIRGTSYIYTYTPLTDAEAKAFEQQGFEIALHLNTNCANYTPTSLERDLTNQLADFKAKYPSVAPPSTNRTHCIAWSDWHTQPKLEAPKGIRLDANYYYWPSPWVQDRPGMFTGSGIPMRFADLDGELIDCYQLTTQMTDESDQSFPYTIDQLLNKALGVEGYYGVFCANMHTDAPYSDGSDKIIASAKARNVPVISSKQLLTWLDGRNSSSFGSMIWSENELSFRVHVASGAKSLQGMLPMTEDTGRLIDLKLNGTPVSFRFETIKGIEYAFFQSSPGNYVATYDPKAVPNQPPVITITSPAIDASFEAPANINILASAADKEGSVAKVEFFNGTAKLGEDVDGSNGWSYDWNSVMPGSYSLTAKAIDNDGAEATSQAVTITVSAKCPCNVFLSTDAPANALYNDGQGVQVGMKFRASTNGYVTGVRFHKQSGNTGTHTGQLYSSGGALLASVVFSNETATGWQQAAFSSPVAITAGTTYVISYHSSAGYYSSTNQYFTQATDSPPLKGLANGEDGPNGVYRYTSSPAFPTSNYQSGNYWVDVVFNTDTAPTNQPPAVTITAPANNTTFTAPAAVNILANATDSDGTVSKVEFFNGTTKLGEDMDGSNGWSFDWSEVPAGSYTLTAKATDDKGAVTTSSAVNITVTRGTFSCPCTVFKQTDAPANALYNDGQGVQVGMKFRASTNGYVTGVRFHKQSGNTGTHTGQLYSSGGALLASVVFSNETATGWQQAAFSSPVAITAGTTYVISYHSSGGTYSADNPYFTKAVENGPLRALASGEDGPNGVYKYSSNPTFPDEYYLSANYWVDVVFSPDDAPANQLPVISITSPTEGASFTAPASINIVAAASDPDGSVSKVEFYNGETKLGETVASPYEFTWSNVAAGSYTLTASATDNAGAVTNAKGVNITVTALENRPPVVVNPLPDQTAVIGMVFTFTFDQNTFTDPDEDSLTYTASLADGATLPAWLAFNGTTRTFSGTPPAGSQGQLSVRVLASDGKGGPASDDFVLSIGQSDNQAPVLATIGNKTVNELSQLSFVATATDDGLPNNSLSYSIDSPVTEASINPATGTFSWTPTEAQGPGVYTFTIRVTDGELYDEETITVQVAEVNQAPVLANVGNKEIGVGQTLLFTLQGSDADIPAQQLTYSANKLPAGATLNANTREFTWAPTSRQVGSHKIIFRLSDGITQVNESITITVRSAPVASAPVITAFSPTSGSAGDQVIISGSNFSDVSSVAFNGVQAVFNIDNSSSITAYVPNGATTGKISVSSPGGTALSEANFTVSEGSSGVAPTISITTPSNGSSYTAPASISISAAASDPDGIVARVEFFQGITKIGEDTNDADGWSLLWDNVTAGSYALTAKAIDNTGLSATSEVINVSVTSTSTGPPFVTNFSPTSGPVGESVLISGDNLFTANKVTFGPSIAEFAIDENGNLIAKVPAVNGKLPSSVKITVSTPSGNSTTNNKFTITSNMAASTVSTLQQAELVESDGLTVYPNPFSDKATISITLQENSDYYVRLYDNKGALVAVLWHGHAKAGEQYNVEVDGRKLARGLYLVRLQTDAGSRTVKLILDK